MYLYLHSVSKVYQKSNMKEYNELIHLRIPQGLSDILNKMAFDTGMSKQELCRLMIYSYFERKYNLNIATDIHQIKKEISNEKTNFITP